MTRSARLGSCNPARLRRTASLTAVTASFVRSPADRAPLPSSGLLLFICIRRPECPSTSSPHRLYHCWSPPGWSIRLSWSSSFQFVFRSLDQLFCSRSSHGARWATSSVIALALGLLGLLLQFLDLLLARLGPHRPGSFHSASARISAVFPAGQRSAHWDSIFFSSFSFLMASRSISSWRTLRSSSSTSSGTRFISDAVWQPHR